MNLECLVNAIEDETNRIRAAHDSKTNRERADTIYTLAKALEILVKYKVQEDQNA